MASLTNQADQTKNQIELSDAVTEAHASLDNMTDRISELGDFEIDTNFDFSPQDLGIEFRSRALSYGYTSFNSQSGVEADAVDDKNYVKFSTTGSKGRFTPVNQVTQGDIPDVSGIDDPAEAIIDTDVPEKPTLVTVTPIIVSEGTKPGVGPVITDPDEVDAPTTVGPAVPILEGVVLPDLYSPNIPLFTTVVPEIPPSFAAPPADTFTFDGGNKDYSDAQLVQLQTVLLDDLNNGGYGVFHTDEEAIFAREVDRETAAAVAGEEELFDSFTARGFPLPTGPQVDLLKNLQQQTMNKISSINREVGIQRNALVRESRALAFGTTVSAVGALSTYRGFFYERLLKAQQFAATYAIQAFEASVEIYNLEITYFNAHASEFRLRLEAEIAMLEQNKVILQKADAQQNINDSEIALYSAQFQALSIEAQIYNTKVAAAKTKSDIQISKLDRYKLEYQIYAAELSAESTKVANYTAQVGANEADVRLYATETNAYGTKVEAQKAQEGIYLARFDADVKRKELEFEEYNSKIKLLETELGQEADAIKFQLEKYNADSFSLNSYTKSIDTGLDALAKEQEFISDEAERDLKWLSKNEEIKQTALLNKTNLEVDLLRERISSLTGIMNALSASISHSDIVIG
jgi:hypothetical protein